MYIVTQLQYSKQCMTFFSLWNFSIKVSVEVNFEDDMIHFKFQVNFRAHITRIGHFFCFLTVQRYFPTNCSPHKLKTFSCFFLGKQRHRVFFHINLKYDGSKTTSAVGLLRQKCSEVQYILACTNGNNCTVHVFCRLYMEV